MTTSAQEFTAWRLPGRAQSKSAWIVLRVTRVSPGCHDWVNMDRLASHAPPLREHGQACLASPAIAHAIYEPEQHDHFRTPRNTPRVWRQRATGRAQRCRGLTTPPRRLAHASKTTPERRRRALARFRWTGYMAARRVCGSSAPHRKPPERHQSATGERNSVLANNRRGSHAVSRRRRPGPHASTVAPRSPGRPQRRFTWTTEAAPGLHAAAHAAALAHPHAASLVGLACCAS